MDKWYKNVYRRNLIDMHINDTDEKYLSLFNAEDYFSYLKQANIVSPMIYLQSHVGLCYFPTKVSKTHEYFIKNPNEINKLIKLCKDDGMKVVGYYSLIFNNQAVKDHPDWEMINDDSSTWRDHGQRYGLCCPNNEEYKEFLKTQIKELFEFYPDIDAIFYDMPYWEVTCHCPSCQNKWKQLTKEEMPNEVNWSNPTWKQYVKARQDWMGEFVKFVKEETNKIKPNVTVEFNFAAVVGCNWLAGSTEVINEECEFTGGDLYGDLYNHSFTAKYYYSISKNQPFEYMTCRCNKNLREHTISKNELTLESEIMLTCMHHGASLIIDAINPDGTLDHRVSNRIGKVFDIQKPYEKYMDKGELYSDIAVYFDSTTQYNYLDMPSNKDASIQAVRTLIENHYPVSIIANKHLNNLDKYKVIIAPNLDDFDNPERNKLIDYVSNGGILYLSGNLDSKLLLEFFKAKKDGFTYPSKYTRVHKGYDEVQAYIHPIDKEYINIMEEFKDEKYPLPIVYKLPIIANAVGEVKANIYLPYTDPDNNNEFASIHSNPPGIVTTYPAILETNYGKGKVIYSIAPIEADPRYNFKDIFTSIINRFYKPKFILEASKYVEMITFKDNDTYYINLFDLNFANDVVNREFSLSLDSNNYEAYELISNRKLEIVNNKIKGNFTKYISLIIKKK